MMKKSQNDINKEKLSMREFMKKNYIQEEQHHPQYPPNHIQSVNEQSAQSHHSEKKFSRKPGRKIFSREKNFFEETFQQTNDRKKAQQIKMSIDELDSFAKANNSSFREYSKNYDPHLQEILRKIHNMSSQAKANPRKISKPALQEEKQKPVPPEHLSPRKRCNTQKALNENQISYLQKKVNQHSEQLSDLKLKLESNLSKGTQWQQGLISRLQRNENMLSKRSTQIQNCMNTVSSLQLLSKKQQEKIKFYELQIKRAERLQGLLDQNEKLYQQLIQNTRLPSNSSVRDFMPEIKLANDSSQVGEFLSPLLVDPFNL